ncbi:hypothetical protein TcWFU_001561 [Taenia crassiceps]|uniref:Uncharacterized protein n=1 Tax=Taenia crassiceps TaxID=6207 RepID=A0ABR4QCW6_9CEST
MLRVLKDMMLVGSEASYSIVDLFPCVSHTFSHLRSDIGVSFSSSPHLSARWFSWWLPAWQLGALSSAREAMKNNTMTHKHEAIPLYVGVESHFSKGFGPLMNFAKLMLRS